MNRITLRLEGEERRKMDWSKCSKFLVPVWKVNEPLEAFITALKSAKEMKVVPSDAMLIYSSMVKSDRSDICEALTTQQRSNLDEFISFLRSSYGPTQQELRLQFNGLTQHKNEDVINYFLRTEKSYFRSKNIERPSGDEFLDDYKEDIKFQFVRGLANNEVKKLLLLNQVSYEDLSVTARNYTMALKDTNISTVNNVNIIQREEKDEPYRRSRSRYRRSPSGSRRRRKYHEHI